jgi:hypothetical protein
MDGVPSYMDLCQAAKASDSTDDLNIDVQGDGDRHANIDSDRMEQKSDTGAVDIATPVKQCYPPLIKNYRESHSKQFAVLACEHIWQNRRHFWEYSKTSSKINHSSVEHRN